MLTKYHNVDNMILLTTTTLPANESLVEDQLFNLCWILLFNKSSTLAEFITNPNGVPNNLEIKFGNVHDDLKSWVQFGYIDSLPFNQNDIDLL
jgi:hypothetical protein